MPALDIFNDDAFSVQSLSKAINETPYTPGMVSRRGWFSEEGVTTTLISIEKQGNALALVPAGERGQAGIVIGDDKRTLVPFQSVHLPQRGTIIADTIQNLRAFGSESELQSVQTVVNRRLAKMRRNIDVTIEFHRLGAIKGVILDADGSTALLNLFDRFGIAQQTHAMALNSDATKVKTKVVEAKRKMEDELGGNSYTDVVVLCGSGFFDAFVSHPAVAAAYDRWMDGQFLREDNRRGFYFAGCYWTEYRGKVGAVEFIGSDDAYMVPEGVPDLFTTMYAPADYMETVNTNGLPYYAKQELMPMGKGVHLEAQSNPLTICTRPRVIIKLTKV